MKNKALITLQDVHQVFYTDEIETHALSNVDLAINRGEYVAVTGPSGCGKSTLLSLLGLLDSPTQGTYLLDGVDVSSLDVDACAHIRNEQIGFIFQSFNLISDLNVSENVALPLTYRDGVSRADKARHVAEALAKVDMANRASHFPAQLSGGQQQRVAIARAMVGNPSILLADEPTGNLDSTNANNILDLLAKLHADGATICMVTHDPRSANCAERCIELFDGKIIADRVANEASVVSAKDVA